jgi:hypothetical protein
MTKKIIITCLIFFSLIVYFYFSFIPLNSTKEFLLTTNQHKQIVKNILSKQLGFELPDECDVNAVAIRNGKDKLIYVKGILDHTELIPFQNNTEYQNDSFDKHDIEIILSLFKSMRDNQHIIISKARKFKKKNEIVEIIIIPNNNFKTNTIFFHIIDNKFPRFHATNIDK